MTDSGDTFIGDHAFKVDKNYGTINYNIEAALQAASLHQLPPPPPDFVGREAELAALLDDVKTGHVVISGLRGQGGIGKTALALKLAASLAPQYPDAQFFLDLRGVSERPLTPAEAMTHVIRAYHPTAKLPDDASLRGLYFSVLNGQRALILMDNARDAAQVEPLLPPPAACLMLVTSRQRFALPGLHATDLEALSDDDAVKLLIEIAPRLAPAAAVIARLCANLPLALRLTASALAERLDLTPDDLIRRLSEAQTRLKLTGVEASLTLSYDLLTSSHQSALCTLSVFPDSFDRAAATALLNLDPDRALDVLGELVKYSVLDFLPSPAGVLSAGEGLGVGAGRYRLHDLTRLFAATRLPEAERYEARKRHAVHYEAVLRSARKLYEEGGNSIKIGLALFDLEWTNIQAGQAWAAENNAKDDAAAGVCNAFPDWPYLLDLRLHPRERIRWLEAALTAARHLKNREAEGAHLGNLGSAYYSLGETRKAIEFYGQHLTIAREIADRRGEGAALGNLGLAWAALGETRKAIEFYEQDLTIARDAKHGDRRGEGTELGNLGNAYYSLGETRKAIEFYEQHLAIARETGDRRGEGNALSNLGVAYAALDETRKAIEFYEQALAIDREIGDRRGEGATLGNLGSAYYSLGETRKAIEFYEQHLAIARETGNRGGEGIALGNLGSAYKNLGETRKAIEFYEQALAIDREIGDRRGEGADLGNLGIAYAHLGETRKAIEFYEQQLKIFREIGYRFGEGTALFNMNLALNELGERKQAITNAETALKIYEEIESPYAERVRKQLAAWREEGKK